MQVIAMDASIATYRSPAQSFAAASSRELQRDILQRCTDLLSAGVARAPAYEGNWMLARLIKQEDPGVADGQVAEAVVRWLCTGRAKPAPMSSLRRYRLGETRDAPCAYGTYTQTTLRRDAWRQYPELRPILVEGSPDAPSAKAVRNLTAVRRTHQFVMVRMAGRMYVIDGARGMVFDSLGAYLEVAMLPGHRGEVSARMKWFRIFDGCRDIEDALPLRATRQRLPDSIRR